MKKNILPNRARQRKATQNRARLAAENLRTYFHDHLAGAMGALELLSHLIKHTRAASRRTKLVSLRNQISQDHDTLLKIVQRLELRDNPIKKALGWLGEKAARLKFSLSKDQPGSIGLVQAMELLALGIAGKRALWDALAATQPLGLAKLKINFAKLISRADKQRTLVERWRLEAACEAFI
jgi:hypothetical protein